LTSHLGDPRRKVLTVAQLRTLERRVKEARRETGGRELSGKDLLTLGYSQQEAERILTLLSQEQMLDRYLEQAAGNGCVPITRVSPLYPATVRQRLGEESPGCLWAKGNIELLQKPMIALVGSRDLWQENRLFAREVGKQAALHGFALVSGNARGADSEGQYACLDQGGTVISVVADALRQQPNHDRILYLSEDDFDMGFSSRRALSRNRVIHCLGSRVYVAQSSWGKGGTWSGTMKNLRGKWSPVFCFNDGSHAAEAYAKLGATLVDAVKF